MAKNGHIEKAAEFRGRTVAQLENIDIRLKSIEKKMDKYIWKLSGIASTIGLIVSVIMNKVL